MRALTTTMTMGFDRVTVDLSGEDLRREPRLPGRPERGIPLQCDRPERGKPELFRPELGQT